MIWRGGGTAKSTTERAQIDALTREVVRLRPFEARAKKQAADIAVLKAHLWRARDNVAILVQRFQDGHVQGGHHGGPAVPSAEDLAAPVVLFDHKPMVILVSEKTGQEAVYDETTYREIR